MIRELNRKRKPQRPQRRVPDCDMVEVGPAGSQAEALDLGEFALPQPLRPETPDPANKHSADGRSLVRPLSALLLLELGLLGALYVGKRYADAQVIVVPATTNERSVIT